MSVKSLKQQHNEAKNLWNVKKAGERLLWRLMPSSDGIYKSFTPNESDVLALKSVLSCINRNESDNINNNQLFAKLYLYYLTQNIRYYQTSVFEKIPQVELNNMLNKPLDLFYEAFINDLYGNQLARLLQDKSLTDINGLVVDLDRFKESYNRSYIIGKLDEMMSEVLNRLS